jgi:hypothetical protein
VKNRHNTGVLLSGGALSGAPPFRDDFVARCAGLAEQEA